MVNVAFHFMTHCYPCCSPNWAPIQIRVTLSPINSAYLNVPNVLRMGSAPDLHTQHLSSTPAPKGCKGPEVGVLKIEKNFQGKQQPTPREANIV